MYRLCIACLLLLAVSSRVLAEEGYEDLFNGKDLSGWEGNPELWSVQDGILTGETKGGLKYNQFLIWTGGKVGDFELKLDFRLEGDNNSGVQYRSAPRDTGKWAVKGYQADIHSNPPYTGMLYDEGGRGILAERGQKVTIANDGEKTVESLDVAVEPVDLTQWHELTIIARGGHLIHKLDGVTAVEIFDNQESERDLEGILALQVHVGKPMKAQFRNIRLKKLDKPQASLRRARRAARAAAASRTARPEEACWIWRQPEETSPSRVALRKEFSFSGPVAAARLFLASSAEATFFFDGEEVGSHQSAESVLFQDISSRFKPEETGETHVLAVEAAPGAETPAVLVILEVESGFRDAWTFVSDDSWSAGAVEPPGDGARPWMAAGFNDQDWKNATVVARLGESPWKLSIEKIHLAARLKPPEATPVEQLKVAKDFQVELLYSVPKDEQGSWVSMCVDGQGRLIVCDQYGGLFRLTPPGILGADELQTEKINVDIGEAQGLLWAFDSLYVVVNGTGKYESGVYRVRDTDGDDQLDHLETLRLLPGSGGEHGPHAAMLSPDGESIYIVCGNKTFLTDFTTSRVPRIWDEDALIPRLYGKGFMKGVPAPGGYISRIDPDGKNWELVCVGFRNEYDAAFNADGELVTYDADMEWDMNTPWYRPTRLCHVLSGTDYGWRNGGAKFLEHFPETLPPVLNVGPGSPTGVVFGYDARFPVKYQKALFICDWSYGKLYAVHMEPQGASYTATFEEFITGTPLPLTDIVVNPRDGAMYFTIGGRRIQSGLYRVTYTGKESTARGEHWNQVGADARGLRHKLENLHVGDHPDAVDIAWPYLSSEDRVIRAAARTAIEHRPTAEWQQRALSEPDPQARLEALLALCRCQNRPTKKLDEGVDTPVPDWTKPSAGPAGEAGQLQAAIFLSLTGLNFQELTAMQQFAALRVMQLAILRLGQPSSAIRDALLGRIPPPGPTNSPVLNNMLLDLYVSLDGPKTVERGIELLQAAPSQEEQINYAKALRFARQGWTPELLESYFRWFIKASGYRGGAGFELFVTDIRTDALKLLSDEQKVALQPILDMKPKGQVNPFAAAPRPFVKEWKMDELAALLQQGLKNRDYDHGRKMFGAANCFACHRFNGEGGAMGPDLTALAGRFDARAILDSVLDPSKEISDQYAAVQILTVGGKVIVGRIVNLAGDTVRVNTNMLDPDALAGVDRKEIEEMVLSKTSMMPTGLLNTLNQEEVLDLMAFLLSRGDRNSPMFQSESAQVAR